MKARWSRLLLAVFAISSLLSGCTAWAQSADRVAGIAMAGTMLMVVLTVAAAAYIYMSMALQTIAIKTSTPNGWLAWIPIANLFLMLSVAKKPMWWFVLFLIPIVNIVIAIMVWMAVAEARRKPHWWGILTIVPGVNLVVPGYLAWSE